MSFQIYGYNKSFWINVVMAWKEPKDIEVECWGIQLLSFEFTKGGDNGAIAESLVEFIKKRKVSLILFLGFILIIWFWINLLRGKLIWK